MAFRGWVWLMTWAAMTPAGFGLRGQTAEGPTVYTVTANNPTLGAGGVTRTYRLGSKVLVDQSGTPAEVSGSSHTVGMRTLYDLDRKVSLSWDPVNNSTTCVKVMFSGDWGDPFAGAAGLMKRGARQIGSETVRGFATRILETPMGPKGATRAWVDTKTGLVVKEQVLRLGEAPQTVMEVSDVSLGAPDASLFEVPESCEEGGVTQPASAGRQPAKDEMTALVGPDSRNYVSATVGPGSKNSCAMAFRVLRAGTMEPVAIPFQVAVDLKLASEHSPHYTVGMNEDGLATFAGGGLHEVKAGESGGVFRVEEVPEEFEMDLEFGSEGAAATKVYRQCFAPQTVLLYLMKDPEHPDSGGWVWVKAGKYASAPR